MIKAIVFDCFGVLAVDGWLPFKTLHFGSDPDKYEQATSLNKRSDGGLISYAEYLQAVADLAGVPVQTFQSAIEHNPSNKPLFAYITEQLKPQYALGMLSNSSANWVNEIFTPQEAAVFDQFSLSYETGFVKPDVRAFEDIASKLQVAPDQCVFIDDQASYGDGALEVGMKFICYTNFEQMKSELEQILHQA